VASVREQRRRIDNTREYGKSVLQRELATWTGTVVAEWSPNTQRIPPEAEVELDVVLRRAYDKIANRLLGTDYRIYKQGEIEAFEGAMRAIATALAAALNPRLVASSRSILGTLRDMMLRSSATAMDEEGITPQQQARAARLNLGRRMRDHRVIIAVTESNWTVNTTQKTAVLAVKDALGDSVERIAQLFESGDINGARRLAREAVRMARLPTSVSEGELLNTISDFRDRLVTPLVQGRIIASMRQQAERLDSGMKRWEALFDNTRPEHAAASGQEQPADEPFDVGGYRMQYPMDGSLGAPLSMIIGCNCRTVWL